jgi:branched-chain amino acid transport system permease protein
MQRFLGVLVDGVVQGAILAAMALAIVIIWRSTRILNFAQGVMAVTSVYVAWWVYGLTGNVWIMLPVGIVAGAIVGLLVDRIIIRFVNPNEHVSTIIITFGILSLFYAGLGIAYGPQTTVFPPFLVDVPIVKGAPISANDILSFVIVGVLMAVISLIYTRTSLGLRMRAAAFDAPTARLLGVKVPSILTIGWILASAMGAVAALLVLPNGPGLNPNALDGTLLSAFIGAVIGGLESPVGAVLGSLILGVVVAFSTSYIGGSTGPVVSFVLLLVVLLLRPQGIFALKGNRRV